MNVRAARLALALYPLAYRRRYGAEIEALVEDSGASPGAVVDLLRGALAAHLRPAPALASALDPDERMRLGLGSVLFCWVFFVGAGLALYKTTEGRAFSHAGTAHWLIGATHVAVEVLAIFGTLAVVVGAAPLVLAALRQRRERPAARRAGRAAILWVAVFVTTTAILDFLVHPEPSIPAGLAAAILGVWAGISFVCALGCAFAARRGLGAIEVRASTLRASLVAADCLVIAMVGIALSVALYLVALLVGDPSLAAQGNGPLALTSVGVALSLQLVVMVLASTLAIVSVRRTRGSTRALI